MDKEEFKIGLVDIFATSKRIELPILDDDFVQKYIRQIFIGIKSMCRNSIENDLCNVQIHSFLVPYYEVPFLSQHRDYIYVAILPRIIAKLNEFGIQHSITGEAHNTIINMTVEELARWSNYKSLLALKE